MMKDVRIIRWLLIGLAVGISPSVVGGPKIALSESSFSFGKITQHAVLNKRFWIKSIGDRAARIIDQLQDAGVVGPAEGSKRSAYGSP